MPLENYTYLLLAGMVLGWTACQLPAEKTPGANQKDVRPVPVVTHNMQALFEQSRARWQAEQNLNYQFTFRRNVKGSAESIGPVVITVQNGQIAQVRPAVGRGLQAIDPEKENLHVIDSLFAHLGFLLEEDLDSLVIRYDAEFGFPYFAYIDDRAHEHTTSETTIEVRDFFLLEQTPPADSLNATE